MKNFIFEMETKVLRGEKISFDEAMRLADSEDLESLLKSANRIREKLQGNKVDLCSIINAKSGRCSENCKYCAQSVHFSTGIKEYPLLSKEEVLVKAKEMEEEGVQRFSLVTSGRGISSEDLEKVIEIYKLLKQETNLKLCASHGIITYEQAIKLKEAGVSTYHHNLESCKDYFSNVCDSHTYEDRVKTIKNCQKAGLNVCCGGILGLGESRENRIKLALEINNLDIKSIPLNILTPIPGTPLSKQEPLLPEEILRTIALFRFLNPNSIIRYAGGRKALGEKEVMGFKGGINGALVGNYLTTVGNGIKEDIKILKEEGWEV